MHSEDGWRHQGTFWVYEPERALPAKVTVRVPATFVRAGSDSAPVLARLMDLDVGLVLQRFAAGGRCYVADVGGSWVCYGWVSFLEEQIGEIGLSIRLRPGEAYIWDCATVPAYRRRRLYTALLSHMVTVLRMEGISRIWIGADTGNAASQNGIAASGFQPVADLLMNTALAAPQWQLRERPGAAALVLSDIRAMLHGADFR